MASRLSKGRNGLMNWMAYLAYLVDAMIKRTITKINKVQKIASASCLPRCCMNLA